MLLLRVACVESISCQKDNLDDWSPTFTGSLAWDQSFGERERQLLIASVLGCSSYATGNWMDEDGLSVYVNLMRSKRASGRQDNHFRVIE